MSAGCPAFLLFLVSAGLPFGLPPAAEDATLSHAAPKSCLFYAQWAGSSDADGESKNRTEQLLAEPEVQELINKAFAGLNSTIASGIRSSAEPGSEEAKMMEQLASLGIGAFYEAGSMYVEKFVPDDPASISAAVITAMSEKNQARLAEIITSIEKRVPEGEVDRMVKKIDVNGSEFRRIKVEEDAPPFYIGMMAGYVVISVGEGSAEAIAARLKAGAAPAWFSKLRETLPVERPNMVVYVDVQAIKTLVKPSIEDPNVASTIRAMGLATIQSVTAVSGLDGEDFVSRAYIETGKEMTGLFSLAEAKPLTAADFASIPHDAFTASVVRLDGKAAYDEILERSAEVDPVLPRMILGNLESIKDSFDIDVQKDLLNSLGDRWAVYYPRNVSSGQVACISLKNHDRLEATLDKLIGLARGAFGEDGPKFLDVKYANHDITVFIPPSGDSVSPDMMLPSIPLAICLTADELIIGVLPAVKNHLSVMSRGGKTLGDRPEVATLLAGDNPPMAVFFVDTPKIYSTAFPFVQIGGLYAARGVETFQQMALMMGGDDAEATEPVELDISLLPTGRSVLQHLRPEVVGIIHRENGIEIQNRKVMPGASLAGVLVMAGLVGSVTGADSPDELLEPIMGLVMPATKNEMDSKNNLKQIALAMHNYHDVNGKFPPAYSTDEDGKPLLSWRVLILPYLEGYGTYDSFHLDEPWDSEHNKKLIDRVQDVYTAPGSKAGDTKTNYLAVRIKGGPFEGATPKGFRDIIDGTSNTIMVVEASDEKAVIWSKPDDFTPDAMKPTAGLIGLRKDGFLAAMCDGSVRVFSADITAKQLLSLLIGNDGEVIDWNAIDR